MLLRVLALLHEVSMNVREDTTRGDGNLSEELVQLLIISDGELNVSGDDSLLLAFLGGVSSELQDLSDHVLEDGGQVDWSTRTNLAGVTAVLQESSDSSDWELQPSLRALRSSASFLSSLASSSLSFSRHFSCEINVIRKSWNAKETRIPSEKKYWSRK